MIVDELTLPGVLIFTPKRFGDARGWFHETWNRRDFEAAGCAVDFVQDNHSFSAAPGTLRGLHYQAPPHAQAKLVRCTRGRIVDVAVDARTDSPDYGAWAACELSAENGMQMFVPKGFLHGFLTLTPDVEVQYKCSDFYAPEADGSVLWNSVGIDWADWGFSGDVVLSDKDRAATPFPAWQSPFTMENTA